jgi:hypothetical protein
MPRLKQFFSKSDILDLSIPEPNSGCWLWLGSVVSVGYGRVKRDGITMRAHRLSYLLFKGPLISGLQVRHLCNNKLCVNPDHLEQGTQHENAQDFVRTGWYQSDAWKANRQKIRHLTPEQEKKIRAKYGTKKRHVAGRVTFQSLADEYNVSLKVIWRCINATTRTT